VIAVTTNLSWGIPGAQCIYVETRRRTPRVTLLQPIAALAGGERAYVVDASINGVRLSHSAPLPARKPYAVSLDWQGTHIEFTAEVRWTNAEAGQYQSGCEIQNIDPASSIALRRLIDASDEQQPLFECHELIHGVWRKKTTTDPRQPESGFTVSATESVHTIDFLRAAYAAGDRKMRERIRKLAQLSIEHPERRYEM
jgi:hypothetical protein